MKRGVLLLLLATFACGDGAPIEEVDLGLTVTASAEEVALGEPFDLVVVRIWSRDLEPEPFSEDDLEPLVLELLDTKLREDDQRFEETRRYRAFAFTLEDVAAPGLVQRARSRDGGTAREVTGEALHLRVRPALDPSAPGRAEYPEGPLVEGTHWLLSALIAVVVGAGVALLIFSFRKRSHRVVHTPVLLPEPPAPLPKAPHEVALVRLERLRGIEPGDREEMRAHHEEASGILRDYLRDGLGVRAGEMTSEECLASPLVLAGRASLSDSFARCDLVKFAGHGSGETERMRMLDAAEEFVRRSADREGGT